MATNRESNCCKLLGIVSAFAAEHVLVQTSPKAARYAKDIADQWSFASSSFDKASSSLLKNGERVADDGQCRPDWNTLSQYQIPGWYTDAKFEIFIHWSLYPVPAFGNESWGYIENDSFESPDFMVHQLVDVVSKNGNLLMNVGPRGDGAIPDKVQELLSSVRSWHKPNGDAIYGRRPWKTFGESPTKVKRGPFHDTDIQPYTAQDFRFTAKDADLSAIELAWSSSGVIVVGPLGIQTTTTQPVQSVQLLASAPGCPSSKDHIASIPSYNRSLPPRPPLGSASRSRPPSAQLHRNQPPTNYGEEEEQ